MEFRRNRATRNVPVRGFRLGGGVIFAGLAVLIFCLAPVGAQLGRGGKDRKEGRAESPRPPQAPSQPQGPPRGFGNNNHRGDPLDGLTEEEKRRVRDVLAKIWQDPEVMAAKESVRISTEEWREALKKAVNRVDPTVAQLMNKLHEQSRSAEVRKRYEESMGPGGPGRPGGPPKGPGMRYGMGPNGMPGLPEYVRALDEEKKKIFLEARGKALEAEAIRALREQMEKLYEKEKVAREQRHRVMMQMRRVLREKMIQIDPRIAKITPEIPPNERPEKRPEKPTDRPQP